MSTWTLDQQREHLLALPWTVQVTSEDGDLVARVSELPGLVAVGSDERELQQELFSALEAMLDALLVHGDPISLPAHAELPWEKGKAPAQQVVGIARLAYDKDAFQSVNTRSSAATRVEPMTAAPC